MPHLLHGDVLAVGAPVPHEGELISRRKKLMILGAGRSGTTFLVKLLTRLTFYTGYSPYGEVEYGPTRAGCEFGIFNLGELTKELVADLESAFCALTDKHKQVVCDEFAAAPFVMKCPSYSWYMKLLVFEYKIPFGHIVIPIRDHREVAKSRIAEGISWKNTPNDLSNQTLACDIILGKAVEAAVLADIPLTFIRFPDIVMDEEYCWSKIDSVLTGTFDIHLDREQFREEYQKLADPSLIKHSARKLI